MLVSLPQYALPHVAKVLILGGAAGFKTPRRNTPGRWKTTFEIDCERIAAKMPTLKHVRFDVGIPYFDMPHRRWRSIDDRRSNAVGADEASAKALSAIINISTVTEVILRAHRSSRRGLRLSQMLQEIIAEKAALMERHIKFSGTQHQLGEVEDN